MLTLAWSGCAYKDRAQIELNGVAMLIIHHPCFINSVVIRFIRYYTATYSLIGKSYDKPKKNTII